MVLPHGGQAVCEHPQGDFHEVHQMYWTLFQIHLQKQESGGHGAYVIRSIALFQSWPAEQCRLTCMLVLKSWEKVEVYIAYVLLENMAKVFSLVEQNSQEQVAFLSRVLK